MGRAVKSSGATLDDRGLVPCSDDEDGLSGLDELPRTRLPTSSAMDVDVALSDSESYGDAPVARLCGDCSSTATALSTLAFDFAARVRVSHRLPYL